MNEEMLTLRVIYTGLAGTLLALFVAAAVNRWSPKVFFLVALRLAIGWQFLFEGLHKVHSHTATSETIRAFSSEPYFRVAPGPIGAYMRKQFDDPEQVISEKIQTSSETTPAKFASLPKEDQAAACPAAVAKQFDGLESSAAAYIKSEAEKQMANATLQEAKEVAAITAAEEKALKEAKSDDEKGMIRAKAEGDRKKAKEQSAVTYAAAKKKAEDSESDAKLEVIKAKAAYARWVYGVDPRSTKYKTISGDLLLSAPERLAHIERLKKEFKEAEEQLAEGLGNGYGIDSKRVAELRMDVVAAETDLAKDANSFVLELKKDLVGTAPDEILPTSRGQMMDEFTMWFLVGVGSCLMAGLLTRLACVMAAGFLVMTYLAHPAFPWYPAPPNTEGNPLFINKNAIECIALLALACMPTGRWLGLDALILRPLCRYKGECCCPTPSSSTATDRPARKSGVF